MKKDVENQGPGFGHTQKCCQIKRLIGVDLREHEMHQQ
jgi:hypothetical protein